MSATGRNKTARESFDFYQTPTWCVQRFLEKATHRLPIGHWLESSAGNGAIIRSVKQFGKGYEKVGWTSVEIQERFRESLEKESNTVWIGDYAKHTHSGPKMEVCITNPPYKLAESMAKHALTQAKCVAMLLRINFLASETRRDWMSASSPDIYVLPNRPSFRGNGSDSTEYAWFVWDDKSCGKIHILESTPKEIRRAEKRL